MEFVISFIIFIIILFLYLHVVSQYKRSEDLEIYEMDYVNNRELQEVCDIKQPILFEFKSTCPEFFDSLKPDVLEKAENYDVKVKDSNDYFLKPDTSNIDYIALPLHSAAKLMKTDPSSHYFSEGNDDFIGEAGFDGIYKKVDNFLKPAFVVQTKYDICFGSKETVTPMRYHKNYRQFFTVTEGRVHIKMTPWKSSKYLHPIKDYDNYEFRSPINVWNPQSNYLNEMDKIKFLEFDVQSGYVLCIPPYWWYSIKYSNNSDTIGCEFTYNSAVNVLANIPDWILYFIQQQNIEKKPSKVVVSASEATVSEATVSEATASEATASESTTSEATASEATASEATTSDATASKAINRETTGKRKQTNNEIVSVL